MLVAGLMSGTSIDAIDVAIVDIRGEGFTQRVQPLAHYAIPFPSGLRSAVLSISNADTHTGRLSQINFLLGELFGDAVVEACRRSDVPLHGIELIGSHGQTVYHQATKTEVCGRRIASTLQIGEPAVIAERTRVPVVADFRPADMAAGGQGAPLVPYVDYLLYRHETLGRVALNIGGIANVTAIPPNAAPDEVIAFDTGPGNMLIDALVSQFSRGTMGYDRDGRMAASGRVDDRLLGRLMKSAFLAEKPPKSAGREQFGTELVSELLAVGLAAPDLVATVTAFTAHSIATGIKQFVAPRMAVEELIVSGGGLKNPEIMRRLAGELERTQFRVSRDFQIDPDAKEAIAFAVLAYETYHGRPANLPSATGARHPAILGKLVRPFR